MNNEATVAALVYWLTNNTQLVIQLLAAITPVLALLLVGLIVCVFQPIVDGISG